MVTAIETKPMGRPKKGMGKEPPTVAVKIDRTLASRARLVAADKGISLADYISDVIRGVVDRDWTKMVRKMGDEG